MDELKLVDQYLEKLDWEVRENSNMTYSLQGLNFYITSKVNWLKRSIRRRWPKLTSGGLPHTRPSGSERLLYGMGPYGSAHDRV